MTKKILVVDDSLFMRMILRDILSDKYTIVEAATGAEADKQIKKEKPSLVLLDIIMPDGEEEGISVLKRAMKLKTKIKVVMITAVGQETIIEECKKLGAVDYITKPFDNEKVINIVQEHLG